MLIRGASVIGQMHVLNLFHIMFELSILDMLSRLSITTVQNASIITRTRKNGYGWSSSFQSAPTTVGSPANRHSLISRGQLSDICKTCHDPNPANFPLDLLEDEMRNHKDRLDLVKGVFYIAKPAKALHTITDLCR